MITFESIRHKVLNHQRINEDEALFLFESPDLFAVGKLADEVNRQKNNDAVYFNVNRHINPTNICVMTCKFCAYSRKPGEEGAYEYTIEQMLAKAKEAHDQGARELHLVGGLHPRWKVQKYIDILTAIKSHFPDMHLKAFTAVEIDWLSKKARKTHRELLIELKAAGLDSLPGGGAEIFHEDVRDAICAKLTDEEWLSIHNIAHDLGMKSNCTMLYGHVETYAHRVDHMMKLRQLQDKTKGFNAFIPLSFQPENNEMGIERYTFGFDDLKTIAVARIYLDNFQHIKAYWIMLGQSIAQLALNFGANDMDGTVTEEKISNMAGGQAGIAMSRSQIEKLINRARKNAIERDTLYNAVGELKVSKIFRAPTPVTAINLLEKAKQGDSLTTNEWLEVAKTSSVHDLAQTFKHTGSFKTKSLNVSIKFKLSQQSNPTECLTLIENLVMEQKDLPYQNSGSIIIDVSDFQLENKESTTLSCLCELAQMIGQKHPQHQIGLVGFKGIWKLAQKDNLSIERAYMLLRESGVVTIESSSSEIESSLTTSEILSLHSAAHKAGIFTIGKATINMPINNSEPMWDAFIERLNLFKNLAACTNLLLGIQIEPGRSNFTTASEYLEAVAFAKVYMQDTVKIVTPLTRIPAMEAKPNTRLRYHPAEKMAGIALSLGSDDLGHITYADVKLGLVLEDIKSAGFSVCLRDLKFDARQYDSIHANIRHIPKTWP